jgi:hypothetical protein
MNFHNRKYYFLKSLEVDMLIYMGELFSPVKKPVVDSGGAGYAAK